MDAVSTLPGRTVTPRFPAPFDLNGLRTYDLESRPSRVFADDLGQPIDGDVPVSTWLSGLPRLGGCSEFGRVRERLCRAHRDGHKVIVALGVTAIENGCGPYVADWVRKGVVSAIALSGAAAIADFELSLRGKTGENADERIANGEYGAARDTADAFAIAARAGAIDDVGFGTALGQHMETLNCTRASCSTILAAHRASIPCTVHVSLGADSVHMHPHVCGSALGDASMIDFRRLCSVVADLAHGVCLNVGSVTLLPNALQKAIAVVRNFGHPLDGLLAVDVVERPRDARQGALLRQCVRDSAELIGHCEFIIPLLHAAMCCELGWSAPVRPAKAA
jgi:hypothetical protein